jgi:hypothetical protein
MSEIILVAKNPNPQTGLLRSIAAGNSLPHRIVYQDSQQNITLTDSGVTIGGRKVRPPGAAFQTGIRPDYFALPAEPDGNMNLNVFRDEQVAAEQQLSHIMSMLAMLGRMPGFRVVNDPMSRFDFMGQTSLLLELSRAGADVPDILLTNNYDSLIKSGLWHNQNILWWSHPFDNGPVKIIEKSKAAKLFESGETIPVQFMSPVKGQMLRLWFIDNEPLLIARQSPPEYSGEREGLERFEYIAPDDNAHNFGKAIGNFIDGFFEIDGVIDKEGRLWIIRFDPDPVFTFLGAGGRNYLASKLIEKLAHFAGIDIEIDADLPGEHEDRETVFLTRMIETLIDVEKARGEQ